MRKLLTLSLLLCCFASQAFAKAPEHADIRVLIDISGSMKQNDPNNLRRPALRMLVGLMQPGTQAGVWTFARWVNNLVPVAPVDATWKQKVQKISHSISSPGQRTNIEDVLDQAARSWLQGAPQFRRHLLLLTDGVVDVARDAVKNAESRQRILDELMPRFKAAEIKVHAIALSANADHDLLKQLAARTGGQYQRVDDANQLQRVFLKIFENAGQPDAVPLAGNKFVIDRSISEATVLVFRRDGAQSTVLHSPDQQSFKTSDLPNGIAWQSDTGYDMITIGSPEPGEWRIEADVDPDNRVMVVTDLKLDVSSLPGRLVVGEQVPMAAYLSNEGEIIRKAAFLDKVTFAAAASSEQGTTEFALRDDGMGDDAKAADGRFSTRVGIDFAEPQLEVVVAADNPTFTRERRQFVAVVEPAELRIVEAGPGLSARLTVDDAVLQPDAELTLWQAGADGAELALTVAQTADGGWQAELTEPALPVHARVTGTSRAGNAVSRTLGPVYPPGVPPVAAAVLPAEPEPAAEPAPEPAPEPQAELQPEPAAPPEPESPPVAADNDTVSAPPSEQQEGGWLLPAIALGTTNLLLIGGGVAFWLLRRKRGDSKEVVLIEGADDTDADNEADSPQVNAA